DATIIQGGGSARVEPHPPVSPLAGLRERFSDIDVQHERGCFSFKRTPLLDAKVLDGPLRFEYFAGRERAGEPVHAHDATRGVFQPLGPVGHGVPDEFSVRITGTVMVPESGAWTLSLVQVGRARMTLDGAVVLDNWHPTGRSDAFMGFGSAPAEATIDFVAGEPHAIEIEFVPPPGFAGIEIGCLPPQSPDLLDRAVALARRADAVVCVVRTDHHCP